ncbi:MAG: AbrB/MazE/SpoVT family DNA-binding domain-containing protein [Crenarchaeota archaeon]|nr:AbrB/MazE/SpoVT family DNA-binding domain-containing protein [Thermoproteota archaeon]
MLFRTCVLLNTRSQVSFERQCAPALRLSLQTNANTTISVLLQVLRIACTRLYSSSLYKYYGEIEYEVRVTSKGQTTIPLELMRKYHIVEGSRLIMVDTEQGILVKPLLGTSGSGSKKQLKGDEDPAG